MGLGEEVKGDGSVCGVWLCAVGSVCMMGGDVFLE